MIYSKMKYLNIFTVLLSQFIFSFCSEYKNTELEEVFRLAGLNRKQLERVIRHYSSESSDSLKLKAAEFLILNMPGKYSVSYNAPWEYVATVKLRWTSSSDKAKVLDAYNLGELEYKEDLKHITAEYLISNIELAFEVWGNKPWGKHISFDTFCKEILPYRISTEPLENWREKVLVSFADLDRSLKEDTNITVVDACGIVNRSLPRFQLDKDFSSMNYTQLMATTRGLCDSQAALAMFVMRGLGIPVTLDFTPQWKNRSIGHNWNSVKDSSGKYISFMGAETDPYIPHQGTTMHKTKAYRETYHFQRVVDTEEKNIPPLLRRNLNDISSEHENMTSVTVPVKYQAEVETGYAYLASLHGLEWKLCAHGEAYSDSIHFQHIGKEILYMPVYFANENQTIAGDPFYVDYYGNTHFLKPDTTYFSVSLSSISKDDDLGSAPRMIGGVFESSDNPDFTNCTIIHTIVDTPKLYNRVVLNELNKSRYIRYRAPRGNCNVAEVSFRDVNNIELKGRYIGSSGSFKDLGDTGDKAFDGNIATFYDALKPRNSWTGLDLGTEKSIASIQYSPRIRGTGIYKTDIYELFCWIDDRWQSIEKKQGTDTEIKFSVPQGALMYIHNRTKNNRGDIFFKLNDMIYFY